ncbi:MAG: cysteinyl-tRNA synthetase [Dehalococcoidia bacterium]|nr:cysteinyl-tRNA synthetase [Dehalococcoidia bacterium]
MHKLALTMDSTLGKVVLFGSGETAPSGRLIHERLFSQLRPPVRVAVLETPAGFQPNSELVAQEVAEFIRSSLQNYSPLVSVIPARSKSPPFSTDDPEILSPMLEANYIFLGPGSPTYAVSHLNGTLAWCYLVGRHRRGATVSMASAAAIAVSARALPVYEIFKAGHDLHWVDGLDFFGPFGLELAIVTHWDNREGGAKLDTSHCYMGQARWEALYKMLPSTTSVLGIDEHTGLVFDFQSGQASVTGKGSVTVISSGSALVYPDGAVFPLDKLGVYHSPPPEAECYGAPVETVVPTEGEAALPEEVAELLRKRDEARRQERWAEADLMRQRLADLGYGIEDTRQGQRLRYKGSSRR